LDDGDDFFLTVYGERNLYLSRLEKPSFCVSRTISRKRRLCGRFGVGPPDFRIIVEVLVENQVNEHEYKVVYAPERIAPLVSGKPDQRSDADHSD